MEVIPHRERVLLEDIDVFANYLVLSEKAHGQGSIRVIDWKIKKMKHYIQFNEEIYAAKHFRKSGL